MRSRLFSVLLAAVFVLCSLLLSSCSSPQKGAVYTEAEKEKYAQEFMADLRDVILPLKERYDDLLAYNIVVSTEEGSMGLDSLYEFAQAYQDKKEASLTIVFSTKTTVAVRLYYTGSAVFYYRYEYDAQKQVEVTARVADSLSVSYDDSLKKTTLALQHEKKEIATFSFKEIEQ